jgi:hypothetical protein
VDNRTGTLPIRRGDAALGSSLIGACIGIFLTIACLLVVWSFYHEATGMPPGKAIRPMWVTMWVGGLSCFGIVLGLPYSILGLYLAREYGNKLAAFAGLVGILVNLLIWPLSIWTFKLICTNLNLNVQP